MGPYVYNVYEHIRMSTNKCGKGSKLFLDAKLSLKNFYFCAFFLFFRHIEIEIGNGNTNHAKIAR
jgi:hypothetical protein